MMALLATGNLYLAEASPYDKIWGIGMKDNDPDTTNPEKWKGQNLLGQALIRVRGELCQDMDVIELFDLGVHAGGDNDPGDYIVTKTQMEAMDAYLKRVMCVRKWHKDIFNWKNAIDL